MRFNVGEKPRSKDGDVRKIRKFLLFPRKIENQIVWLETVIVKQVYFLLCGGASGYTYGGHSWRTVSYELINPDHMEHV